MKDAALFIGWKRAVPGKESVALELFSMATSYFEGQKKRGTIEGYEPVLIGAHAGDLNGFMLIRGTPEKLAAVRRDDEFLQLVVRCEIALEGFGAVEAYCGDSLTKMMDLYRKNL